MAYTNYLVANKIVLMPVFGNGNDQKAREVLVECFPGRKVIGIPCVTLTEEGGAIQCALNSDQLFKWA